MEIWSFGRNGWNVIKLFSLKYYVFFKFFFQFTKTNISSIIIQKNNLIVYIKSFFIYSNIFPDYPFAIISFNCIAYILFYQYCIFNMIFFYRRIKKKIPYFVLIEFFLFMIRLIISLSRILFILDGSVIFIAYSQPFSSFKSSTSQNFSAVFRTVSWTKSMFVFSFSIAWLKSPFHFIILSIL